MICDLEFVAQCGSRFVHRCRRCGWTGRLPFREPARVSRRCGASGLRSTGPGTHFRQITRELRVNEKEGCDCAKLEKEMNAAGIDGCKARRDEFLARIKANARKYRLAEWAAAGWNGLWQGKPWSIEGLYDLAIEQAIQVAQSFRKPQPPPQ